MESRLLFVTPVVWCGNMVGPWEYRMSEPTTIHVEFAVLSIITLGQVYGELPASY